MKSHSMPCSAGSVRGLKCRSPFTRTCCAAAAATPRPQEYPAHGAYTELAPDRFKGAEAATPA